MPASVPHHAQRGVQRYFSTSEVARICNVSSETVRLWERNAVFSRVADQLRRPTVFKPKWTRRSERSYLAVSPLPNKGNFTRVTASIRAGPKSLNA